MRAPSPLDQLDFRSLRIPRRPLSREFIWMRKHHPCDMTLKTLMSDVSPFAKTWLRWSRAPSSPDESFPVLYAFFSPPQLPWKLASLSPAEFAPPCCKVLKATFPVAPFSYPFPQCTLVSKFSRSRAWAGGALVFSSLAFDGLVQISVVSSVTLSLV